MWNLREFLYFWNNILLQQPSRKCQKHIIHVKGRIGYTTVGRIFHSRLSGRWNAHKNCFALTTIKQINSVVEKLFSVMNDTWNPTILYELEIKEKRFHLSFLSTHSSLPLLLSPPLSTIFLSKIPLPSLPVHFPFQCGSHRLSPSSSSVSLASSGSQWCLWSKKFSTIMSYSSLWPWR